MSKKEGEKKTSSSSPLRFWLIVGAVVCAVASAISVNCFGARNPFHFVMEHVYW